MKTFDVDSILELIDIDKTISKFGYPKSGNSKAVIICGKCHLEYDRKLYYINKNKKPLCKKCVVKNLWESEDYRSKVKTSVSITSKKMWENEDYKKQASEKSKLIWSDPARRERASVGAKLLWENEDYKKQASLNSKKMWENEDYKKQASEKSRHLWENDQYREKIVYLIRQFQKSNSYIEKRRLLFNSEERRLRQSRLSRQMWESESFRNKHHESMILFSSNPEFRLKVSAHFKKLWSKDDYKSAQSILRSMQNKRESNIEKTTQSLLLCLDIKYNNQFPVGPWVFDLFIPSHNLLIECQGEYWHSSDKVIARDAAKFTYINEYFPQYRVLYLYERDFLNPGIIKQKLVRELFQGEHKEEQINFKFSDVEIRSLDPKIKLERSYYSAPEEFLQAYHYAGYGRSSKHIYGAFHGDNLIAVCKFTGVVRKEVATSLDLAPYQVLELDRFCIHPAYQKKNFASWMISRCSKQVFEELEKIQYLVSFADSTFGHSGTIYRAANWIELGKTKPSYHYISQDGFVIHKKTLWNKAVKMGETESDYAAKHGYVKIAGKEKTKFILKRA